MGWEERENKKTPWSGASVSPEQAGPAALQMDYLRLAQWSRAWSLGTEPGLRLGSSTSCLGQLDQLT